MTDHLFYYRVAAVVSGYDGDTLAVSLSLEFKMTREVSLRLARLNTPEIRSAEPERSRAIETRDYLRKRLADALSSGEPVVVRSVKLEKYGRSLAELYVGEVNVNDELLALGLAEPYTG